MSATAVPPALSESPAAAAGLSLRGISKHFPGVLANDHIDLDVARGEVHAILGENGAGKSTLMKILYGFYQPDAGTISRAGTPIGIHSPHDGRRHGIGMVFQNFTLVPALTVAENIALVLPALPFVLPLGALAREIRALSDRYHFDIDPRAYVRDLSLGEQQKVEILKLLLARAEFLIFDEPTSVLAPHESDEVMEVFRRLRADDLAVLFITHKLREVLAVADRITVLRRGAVSATLPAAQATETKLVALMLGSEPAGPPGQPPRPPGLDRSGGPRRAGGGDPLMAPETATARVPAEQDYDVSASAIPALEIDAADVPDPTGRVHLRDISLAIHAGQIVGVAGVSGNGQRELGDLVLGLRQPAAGTVRVFGEETRGWSPARVLAAGVGCLPEDPLGQGAVPAMTVLQNMVLSERARYAGPGGLSLRWGAARADVERALARFQLAVPPLDTPLATLSGGNVQRVIFARELARAPRLLVSFHPTRGLDVPTAATVRALLLAHRDAGAAILLVSEDLDELFALSDRLIVMHHGRIVGTFRPEETDAHAVGLLMTGAGGDDGERG